MVDEGGFPNAAAAAHDAAWTVLQDAAHKVLNRSRRYTLDEVSVELGVDPDRVRERAARTREEDDGGGG
jgi:hypothetical protein